jgi:hypothetical protein
MLGVGAAALTPFSTHEPPESPEPDGAIDCRCRSRNDDAESGQVPIWTLPARGARASWLRHRGRRDRKAYRCRSNSRSQVAIPGGDPRFASPGQQDGIPVLSDAPRDCDEV